MARVNYKGALFTQSDMQAISGFMNGIQNIHSAEEFQKACEGKSFVTLSEKPADMDDPNISHSVEESLNTNTPAVLPDQEDKEHYINVLFVKSMQETKATIPADDELREIIKSQKMAKAIEKNWLKWVDMSVKYVYNNSEERFKEENK
jgi:hypothetical protein